MANESKENTKAMIDQMAAEGGGIERNAKPSRPPARKNSSQKKPPKKLNNFSDDPNAWEQDPEKLRSPVG